MAAKLGGVKGGKYALGQNADINVTPFVDIMLVLLIIFMVSIPPATIAIKVDLPPALNQPNNPNQKPTYISIHQNGDIMIVENGCVHQHFNDDPDNEATLLVFKAKPLFLFMHLLFQKIVEFPPTEGHEDFRPPADL